MSKTQALVTLAAGHPNGQFRRFGFTFTADPEVYTLDDEQLEFLKTLPFLAVRTNAEVVARFSKEPLNDDATDQASMTKAQIFEALEAKGLVKHTDFDPAATKAALLGILNA